MTITSWRVWLAAATLAFAGHSASQPLTSQQQESARQETHESVTQPLNNSPVWREVRSGQPGFTQLGAPTEPGILIQSRGQTWKEARAPLALIGGLLVALAITTLGVFYAWRGPIPGGESSSRMLIRRFRPVDRYAHWTMAIVWVTLATTGLVMSFGRILLLPIVGHTGYSWLATAARYLHNFIGPLLIVGVLWMILRQLRHNWFNRQDLVWLTTIVGNLTGLEYPSGKFNVIEKIVFWLLLVTLSTVLIVTGLVQDFPNFMQTRATMQTANMIHMAAAYVAIAIACVHIYTGTIGMKGAYRAMRDGYVTAEWAQAHHELWYEDVKAGKVPESPMIAVQDVEARTREAVLAAVK
jgi:formate dehydrogenase subunit gamma